MPLEHRRRPPHGWRPSSEVHWGPFPGRGLGHKQRFLFRRFALGFGFMALLFMAAVGLVAWLAFGPLQASLSRTVLVALLACGIPFAFISLTGLVGSFAFRRFSSPVADVMAAADAVAAGDFGVRVREDIPGEFGRLARSFNRMASGLAQAETQRRSLTADVAHELRTPLHILQGHLEGMLDGVYPPDAEHLNLALDETRLLARLVDDLQTLSLAEAGQLPLHRQTVSAADLLSDAAASFAAPAAQAGVTLELDVQGEPAELGVEVDPDRLGQVLNNLLANALRYTPSGGRIILGASLRPAEGEAASAGVRLTVQDTGPGIPPADLPFVFDRFWRGDRSRARGQGAGSGLGLSIARYLVQAHGGTISVESQEGQGANFTIELDRSDTNR
jgi:signal transduction histidine kinase